jgi:hypothetical protein
MFCCQGSSQAGGRSWPTSNSKQCMWRKWRTSRDHLHVCFQRMLQSIRTDISASEQSRPDARQSLLVVRPSSLASGHPSGCVNALYTRWPTKEQPAPASF